MKLVTCCALANVVALATQPIAAAQPAGLEIGGYAGLTSTNVKTTHAEGSSVSSSNPHEGAQGFSFAAYVRYPVLRPLTIEANVMYAQKGYDVSPQVHFHYVEMPIVARLDLFPKESPATAFFYAGLAPAVRVACSAAGMSFDNENHVAFSYSGSCDDAPSPHTPDRWDLGGVVGGGLGWKSRFGILELHGRQTSGLVDIGGRRGGVKTVNKASYILIGFGKTFGR